MYVQYAHTNAHVFQLLKKDGSPWFTLELASMLRNDIKDIPNQFPFYVDIQYVRVSMLELVR